MRLYGDCCLHQMVNICHSGAFLNQMCCSCAEMFTGVLFVQLAVSLFACHQ